GFYGTFTAENGAHKTNMWVDPQGINWFGVAFTVSDTVIMYTFDPATGAISNEVPSAALSGVLPGDGYAIGPNGEFGVFGYMTNPADTTQTGFGYSWYDPNTGDFVAPVFAFQDTFANGWFWDDGAFGTTTDEFFFVTDVMSDTGLDLPDAVYFIHYNAGNVSVTRLDDPAVPKRVHYPQIAVSPDRQTLVVLWAQADPATGDTAIGSPSDGVKGYMWDIYAVGSTDGGQTWGNPVNLTNTPNLSEWMPHLAKNLDVVNGKFYFVYATDLSGNNIDGYVNVLAPNGALVSPMYHVTSEDIVTSVSEGRVPVRTGTAVVFEHNRLNGSLGVRFSARTAGQVRVDLINVLGQTVRSWTRTAQVGENAFTLGLNGVAKGTYVVRLVTPEGSVHTGKFAVLR
ncbi:MAG: T9SS type A sorting domain-containing protein, partial [Candidatus Hydrothermae bacterium]|nr:T9SS type A sorting domain-containing protein [Candidatus Hydrothermae bacterium]